MNPSKSSTKSTKKIINDDLGNNPTNNHFESLIDIHKENIKANDARKLYCMSAGALITLVYWYKITQSFSSGNGEINHIEIYLITLTPRFLYTLTYGAIMLIIWGYFKYLSNEMNADKNNIKELKKIELATQYASKYGNEQDKSDVIEALLTDSNAKKPSQHAIDSVFRKMKNKISNSIPLRA